MNTVTVMVMDENGQHSNIVCHEKESLLDALIRQGNKIPYACKGGGCGLCKIKIVEGQFERLKCSKAALNDEERTESYTLACKTYPKSSMRILLDVLSRTLKD